MTNEMIIFTESQNLAKEGKINYTGRTFKTVINGKEIEVKETEAIHTFAAWKAQGYKVKKGSKAVASFLIWKYSPKKEVMKGRDKATSEEVEKEVQTSKMFMTKAAFFSASQVEFIGE